MKKVVELYRNPKKRLLVVGPLYLIFFIFVFAQYGNQNTVVQKSQKQTIDNYESIYQITFSPSSDEPYTILNIDAKRYQDEEIYYITETQETYYREENDLYNDDNDYEKSLLGIDFVHLTQENIEKYQSLGKELYKTEYSDGKIEKAYEISVSDFSEIYGDFIDNEEIITLKICMNNEKIESVFLDMSSVYFMQIEIHYQRYNEVEKEEVWEDKSGR